MMRNKLGLFGEENKDEILINDLLRWMKQSKADYTNTFCLLMSNEIKIKKEKNFQDSNFIDWYKRWKIRLSQNKKSGDLSLNLMNMNNPLVIPRNHKVEECLEAANKEQNLELMKKLLKYLNIPYENQEGIADFQNAPKFNGTKYKTFCGT